MHVTLDYQLINKINNNCNYTCYLYNSFPQLKDTLYSKAINNNAEATEVPYTNKNRSMKTDKDNNEIKDGDKVKQKKSNINLSNVRGNKEINVSRLLCT